MKTVKVLFWLNFAILISSLAGEQINGQSRRGAPPSAERIEPPLPLRPLQPIDGVIMEVEGRFTVTDPRPLARAAELLERKLGVPISYEEPLWTTQGDIMAAADLPQNHELTIKYPNWRGPLGPRSSTVDVLIPTTEAERKSLGAARIIQSVLDNHRGRRNPGEFKLLQLSDGAFSIVCERVEDATGRVVEHTSPLDVRISLPEQERTISQTLDVLVQAINTTGSWGLERPTIGPPGYFDGVRVRIGARNEAARDVLARIVKIPGGPKFAWGITSLAELRRVGVEAIVPGIGIQLLELHWPKQ